MELLEWDAKSYDELPLPHTRWGIGVLDQLDLPAHCTAIDLGAGTGRDTVALLDRWPTVKVIALDGSHQMLDQLRTRLVQRSARPGRPTHDDVDVRQADLRVPLDLVDVGEVAFSVATLHWLPDHQVVFESVARALRPGGLFIAEGGGVGNIDSVRAALRTVGGDDGASFWNFARADETAQLLRAAGFVDVRTRVVADPAVLQSRAQLEAYLATVVLGVQLRALPTAEHRGFVAAVADQLPEPVVDYRRLQLHARLP